MPRGPNRPYPAISVDEATKIAQGIRDQNAGRPMNRVVLAQALRFSPAGIVFRDFITASGKYGFTEGNYNSEVIALSPLGEQVTAPSEKEKLDARRQGFRKIPLFDQLLSHYNNSKLPATELLKTILEKDPFNVRPQWSEEAAKVFVASGKALGFIREISGAPWVVIEAGPPISDTSRELSVAAPKSISSPAEIRGTEIGELEGDKEVPAVTPTVPQQSPMTLQFFIAHGRDREPVLQLLNILKELSIPYVVAEEEANAGRPISQKVKDLMSSCSGGIFIFSADEEFKDSAGVTLFRPRENVVYELGAASYLYDRRIVIFKENGVRFPSDFRDLGYIEFEKGHLAGKTVELLKELIALKAVKLLPGS